MGKIYEFTGKKNTNQNNPVIYSANRARVKETIEILIGTYTASIEDLKGYKEGIKKMDRLPLKNPRELLKLIPSLNKRLKEYGMVSTFYRFVTLKDTHVIYFNDTKLIYTYQEDEKNKKDQKDHGREFTPQEFIQEFEAYPFTLMIGEEIYSVLDAQINKLQITIEILENTL